MSDTANNRITRLENRLMEKLFDEKIIDSIININHKYHAQKIK